MLVRAHQRTVSGETGESQEGPGMNGRMGLEDLNWRFMCASAILY